MTEWDLLVEAEDIKKNSLIAVEDQGTGEVLCFVFKKASAKKVILWDPSKKDLAVFDPETLEHLGEEELVIIGLYSE